MEKVFSTLSWNSENVLDRSLSNLYGVYVCFRADVFLFHPFNLMYLQRPKHFASFERETKDTAKDITKSLLRRESCQFGKKSSTDSETYQ